MDNICEICKTLPGKQINCLHIYCNQCLLSWSKSVIEENPYANVSCKFCNEIILLDIIANVFGGMLEYSLFQNSQELNLCMICLQNKKIKEFIMLNCDHWYCRECFKAYLNYKVDSGDFENIGIACPECEEIISEIIIQENSSESDYLSYTKLMKVKNAVEDSTIKNIKRWCLICNECTNVTINDYKFDCYTCRKSYCARCKQELHDGTCDYVDKEKDEVRENNIIAQVTLIDRVLLEGEQFLQCPLCKVLILKEQGCNFLKCPWPKCKTFFCSICGKILTVKFI